MKLHTLAAAAALAVMSLQAQAVTTYTFDFAGTQTHFPDDWECGGVCPPGTRDTTSDWRGSLALALPDGDGTFLFDWSGVEPNMTLTLHQPWQTTPFSLGFPPGPLFGAVVSGGRVSALTGSALLFDSTGPTTWAFDGLAVFFNDPASHHYGRTFGSGTLAVAAIPEPGTWALLLAGLAFVGRVARRRA